jgi:hypothetical protein
VNKLVSLRWVLAVAIFTGAVTSAAEASARTCAGASDCPLGYTCDGATCMSYGCTTDSDCGPGTRCNLSSGVTTCVTPLDGGPMSCTSSQCVPAWDAPCSADTDCGPGFTCSGAGGYDQIKCAPDANFSIPSYATAAPTACPMPPVPPPNLCDGGTQYCFSVSWKTCVGPTTTACKLDSDCPSTWTCGCEATCSLGPAEPVGYDAGAAGVDAGCSMVCTPPNADLVTLACAGSEGPSNGGSPGPTAPVTPTSDGGGTTSVPVSGASPTSASAPTSAPTGTGEAGSGGCLIGGGDAASSSSALILAMCAWMFRRRGADRRSRA